MEVFRHFFDAIVEQCQQEKLVWGKELYIDSTQVNANADLDSLTPRFAVEARAAIQGHLAALFAEQDSQQENQQRQRSVPCHAEVTSSKVVTSTVPMALPINLSQAEQEELASENAARHDWIAEEGRQQREVHGLYQRTSDFKVSATDPDATPMRLKGGGTHLGYHTHYVVDGGKARIILQVLVTPSEVMDNQPMRDLIFRTRFRWKLQPRHVTGDTKYGTIENIKALEDAGIRAYVPLPNWEERYEVWSASHFRYEAQADQYRCPQGQMLQRVGESIPTGVSSIALLLPSAMPAQSRCSVRPVIRGVALYRHVGEEYLERVRTYQHTPAYQKAMNKRKVWVEPLFAEAKDWHGLRRFRLRLLWRVNCEALRIAAGQNLKRLLKKRGWGRRPFPIEALCASFWAFCVVCRSPCSRREGCWCQLAHLPHY